MPGLYILCIGGTVLILLTLVLLAYLLPGPFLWLLGEKYAGLEEEFLWVLIAACIAQVAAVMWNLNISKAWITVHAIGFIPSILAVQSVSVFVLDLRNFHDVLIFNVVTASAPIVAYAIDAWLGLRAHLHRLKPKAQ